MSASVPDPATRRPRPRTLSRERLLALLPRIWEHRVALVVAPAGSGKTTLLGHLAAAAGAPAAYHLADADQGDEPALLGALERTLAGFLPDLPGAWRTPDDAAAALGRAVRAPTLLLVDDFHTIAGTPGEAAMERLLGHAPPQLAVVLASRSRPGLNWTRRLVSGELIEIGQDDLRFRSWEIERLFRDVYAEPLPPADLATLERRTDGWAAGLMLFHLATRGQPLADRRRTLASLGARWKLAREYLTRNVLDTLDDDLRTFLLETCVLTRLTGPVCDELLGRSGSAAVLHDLEQRQLFTRELADGSFRYHETLRLQLESVLVERQTGAEVRERFRRAGLLLEASGALGDAVRAFCRAEAWDDLSRLLGRNGDRFAGGASIWLDTLPPAVLREDPWLLLALARQQRAAGRLAAAEATYREAEARFSGPAETQLCRRERSELAVWLDGVAPSGDEPAALLRSATVRDPDGIRRRAARLKGTDTRLVEGLAGLLAGRCRDCARPLGRLAADPDASPAAFAAAAIAHAAASLLSGDADGADAAERAAESAERAGQSWLARLGRAVLALDGSPDLRAEATAVRTACEQEGDEWGRRLSELFEGWGTLRAGEPSPELLASAADGFRSLGAGTLEAWASAACALSLARLGAAGAADAAARAEALGRTLGVRAAQALAAQALAELAGERPPETLAELGLALPAAAEGAGPARIELHLFGALRLRVDERTVELERLKPQARSVLARLALAAGRPVHREVLMESFWPGVDPERAGKNLHVLLSILRHVLEPETTRGASSLIVREGAAYRLELGEDAWVDVVEFDRALAEGAAARRSGDAAEALAAYSRALDLYPAELLPGEGPADWVVEERARRHTEAVDAGRAVAELSLELGRPLAAARAGERVLTLDRNDDDLWRLVVGAYERSGDVAAAAGARRRYEDVLAAS